MSGSAMKKRTRHCTAGGQAKGMKNISVPKIISFGAILVVYFFYDLNWMIDSNIRHALVKNAGFSMTDVSLIFSALEFGTIPGTILFGLLSELYNKKLSLMILAFSMGLFTLIPLFSYQNLTVWIISRFLCGIALGGCFGTTVTLVFELYSAKWQAILASVLYSSFSVGIQVSGMMYSFLGDNGWKSLVIICASGSWLGCLLVCLFIHLPASGKENNTVRTNRQNQGNIYLRMYRDHLKMGSALIVLSACNFIGYSLYNTNILYFMRNIINLPVKSTGMIFSISGTGLFIGYYFWSVMANLHGRRAGAFGFLISGVGMIFFMQLNSASPVVLFYIAALVVGFGFGCSSYWGIYYTELFPEKYRSIAAGISFNGGRVLTAVSIPSVTIAASGSIPYIIYCGCGAILLGFFIWRRLPETYGT